MNVKQQVSQLFHIEKSLQGIQNFIMQKATQFQFVIENNVRLYVGCE